MTTHIYRYSVPNRGALKSPMIHLSPFWRTALFCAIMRAFCALTMRGLLFGLSTLSNCLLASLLTCLLAYLLVYLHACMHACMHACKVTFPSGTNAEINIVSPYTFNIMHPSGAVFEATLGNV